MNNLAFESNIRHLRYDLGQEQVWRERFHDSCQRSLRKEVPMALDIFNDPTRASLRSTLNACAERNSVIANNVANADTPGYKRSEVRFEEDLKSVLERGGSTVMEDIQRLESSVSQDNTPSTRPDGNNVNVDKEMSDLAHNTIQYNAMLELMRLKGGMLTTVISGGTK